MSIANSLTHCLMGVNNCSLQIMPPTIFELYFFFFLT